MATFMMTWTRRVCVCKLAMWSSIHDYMLPLCNIFATFLTEGASVTNTSIRTRDRKIQVN